MEVKLSGRVYLAYMQHLVQYPVLKKKMGLSGVTQAVKVPAY
jgi:hypothetical protein